MTKTEIRQYKNGIKIPEWMIDKPTMTVLVYISVTCRSRLMMDGFRYTNITLDSITRDWPYLSRGLAFTKEVFVEFERVVSKYTPAFLPPPQDIMSGKRCTYKIKEINGFFGERHDVYFSANEFYILTARMYLKDNFTLGDITTCNNAVKALCYIKYKLPSLDDWRKQVAIIGLSRFVNEIGLPKTAVLNAVKFLRRMSVIEYYGTNPQSSSGKTLYIPVYALPDCDSEYSAWEVARSYAATLP